MFLGHDHTIYLVPDADNLDSVCQAFSGAGFLLTERDDTGRDSAPSMQRLISFEDGSYIEILAFRTAQARQMHRFSAQMNQGAGWADYVLQTDNLEADICLQHAAGFPVLGPNLNEKTLMNGRSWCVKLALIGIGAGYPALPLLLEDTFGRELRIPQHATTHPNGITGTLGVTLSIDNMDEARKQFMPLFGAGAAVPSIRYENRRRYVFGQERWVDIVQSHNQDQVTSRYPSKYDWFSGTTLLHPDPSSHYGDALSSLGISLGSIL